MNRPGEPQDDAAELRAILDGRRTLNDERWAFHLREHALHDTFHQREHDSTEAAIDKAEIGTKEALHRSESVLNERFAATNEWRQAFGDREREFLTKTEYRGGRDAVTARLDVLEDKELTRSTREIERADAQRRTMALIGLAATVGGFLLSLTAFLLLRFVGS